ncbi:flagellar hook-associated protein FlgL [Bacillus sp. CGMCC 1.16541]|uniref:flagellar hook-associated protein FlgL n=1 Tax=Bacillus sp. CGMCC 1.16541 TaxID=2185143 RepID=UPI000D72E2B5|nr:flagellar hook-associated protein FlgL [Bacillus sp. CGMCC 1.16541]
MRVTQSMLANNMLRNLSQSYANMGKYQDQLATGKKINRPSDDPVVAMKGLTYRTNLMEVEQYKRNFSEAYTWTENTDAALDKATQALQRMRELTVQASNGTYEGDQRKAIEEEIKQLKEHLVTIANSKVGDKYIFNGTNTSNEPVTVGADGKITTTSTNANEVKIELSKGIYIGVNVPGNKLFNADFFNRIEALQDKLTSNGEDISDSLKELDANLTAILSVRAEIGARQNRIDMMELRIDEQEVIANRILSDNEDADIERVITDLKTQESVHRAALGVGSRIIQPTLMDFLR